MKPTAIWGSLLILTALVAWQFVSLENRKGALRQDLATLQDVRHGLLNPEEWKRVIAEVMAEKVETFQLESVDRNHLRDKIEGLLHTLIGDLEESYRADNATRLLGFVRNVGSDLIGIFAEMRGNVPEFSARIVSFLDEPENREELRVYLSDALDQYANNAFGHIDYPAVSVILQERQLSGVNRLDAMQVAEAELQAELNVLDAHLQRMLWIGSFLFLLTGMSIFQWVHGAIELKIAVLTLAVWLGVGVSMPLLLIDARIDLLEFELLGLPVVFSDQVVFLQSKSIFQVVKLLLIHGNGFGTKLAGAGVLLFSVMIPLAKLGATFQWARSKGWAHSFVGRTLLFKSSKWAMADVMVVAIFLSNLGFNGVLKDQFARLHGAGEGVEVLTTAASNLLPGFFAFFGFALLSLLLSARVHALAESV